MLIDAYRRACSTVNERTLILVQASISDSMNERRMDRRTDSQAGRLTDRHR